MGRACSTYGGEEMFIQDFCGETRGKEASAKLSGVNKRIILKQIFKKGDGGMNWIVLAQDRDRWRTLKKGGNEFSVSIKCGKFICQHRGYQYLRKDSAPWSQFLRYFCSFEQVKTPFNPNPKKIHRKVNPSLFVFQNCRTA